MVSNFPYSMNNNLVKGKHLTHCFILATPSPYLVDELCANYKGNHMFLHYVQSLSSHFTASSEIFNLRRKLISIFMFVKSSKDSSFDQEDSEVQQLVGAKVVHQIQ